jgi:hypothetical protein
MNVLSWAVAIGGWLVALIQFFFSYRERRIQHAEDYLERTLKYLISGPHQRAVGLSLIEAVWLPKRERLDVIVPVLVNQFIYIMLSTDAIALAQEERNLVRLTLLLRECLPFARDQYHEAAELKECILRKLSFEGGVMITSPTLRLWYEGFGGDPAYFDVENASK